VATILLPQMVLGQQPAPLPGNIPVGWYVYPESKLKNLNETTLRCFNYSHNEWQVTNEGNGVKITERPRPKGKDDFPPLPSWPPLLKHEEGMPGRSVSAGLRSAMHFEHGWLLAYAAGEWGGGLWLTNEDGSKTKRIVSDNVRAVVPIDGGILVLSGLAHMSMDSGNAFIFSNPDGLNIALQHTVHLDGAPSAYAKQPDGTVLFVTTRGLSRITQFGELKNLTHFPKWTSLQYPNSMVIASDSTIFIAMRMFVLKLHQTRLSLLRPGMGPAEVLKIEGEPDAIDSGGDAPNHYDVNLLGFCANDHNENLAYIYFTERRADKIARRDPQRDRYVILFFSAEGKFTRMFSNAADIPAIFPPTEALWQRLMWGSPSRKSSVR
jgi:hypothetical protein